MAGYRFEVEGLGLRAVSSSVEWSTIAGGSLEDIGFMAKKREAAI